MTVRKAATWAMSAQYFSFVLQFVASLILARYFISPTQLGVFSIAFAAVSLIAFLQDFGVTRYLCGEKDLGPDKLRTAFTVSLTISWAIAALCVALAWPLAAFYENERLLPITLVIAASYFMVPIAIVPQALRQRDLDFRSSAMIDMGAAAANAMVSLYLGWKGYGAMALAGGALAQQFARALIAQWRAGWVAPWPLSFAEPGRLFSFGGTNTVLVTCFLVSSRVPELLIGRMLGPAAVGLFARAGGLALQLRVLLVGAVSGVFFPAFRKLRDNGEPLGPPYLRVVAAFTAIMWPALAGLAVLAEPTVHLLYGEKWMGSASLLFWLALAQMCFVSAPMNADLPILLDEKRELIVRNVVDLVLALVLLALAVPYGLEAIAASRLAHGLLWMANFSSFLKRVVGYTWADWFSVQLRSLAVAGLAVLPALVFYRLWDGPADAGFLQILASAGCGVLLWLAGLAALRHTAFTEIMAILAPLRKKLMPTAS